MILITFAIGYIFLFLLFIIYMIPGIYLAWIFPDLVGIHVLIIYLIVFFAIYYCHKFIDDYFLFI